MPRPEDIDPVDIPQLLPYLFMVDVLKEDPVDYFYRIEGEMVQEALGLRRMGFRLSQLREQLGALYPRFRAWYDEIRRVKAPVANAAYLTALKRGFYRLEMVALPLSRDGETVDRVLTCIGLINRPQDR